MDDSVRAELIPKYEAEVTRLNHACDMLRKERSGAKWWLVILVGAPFGFFFNPFVAFAIFFAAVGLWGITLYLTTVRLNERQYELRSAEDELARLREATS